MLYSNTLNITVTLSLCNYSQSTVQIVVTIMKYVQYKAER